MTFQCEECKSVFVPAADNSTCSHCRAEYFRKSLLETKTLLLSVKVAHRFDCPKVKPQPDTFCSTGVLHLGMKNSRCDCFGEGTELQIKSVADKIDAALAGR